MLHSETVEQIRVDNPMVFAFLNVSKYAVVGAPSAAETLINVMDKIIPIDARTFDKANEQDAWRFVNANRVTSGDTQETVISRTT